jgi:hypothetical protein
MKSGEEGCDCEVGRDDDEGCKIVTARHLSPRPRCRREPMEESNAAARDPESILECIEGLCSLADARLTLLNSK